jgi:hypothetical protein
LPFTVLLSPPLFFRHSSIRESRKKRSRGEAGKTGIEVLRERQYDMMVGGNKNRIE